MECGFSKVCITPKLGSIMAGTMELKHATGVLDDLYARAISFYDGEKRALLISLDLCNMSTEVNDACRIRISEECGIDIDSIMLTCTHTHAGPMASVKIAEANGYCAEDIKLVSEYCDFVLNKGVIHYNYFAHFLLSFLFFILSCIIEAFKVIVNRLSA